MRGPKGLVRFGQRRLAQPVALEHGEIIQARLALEKEMADEAQPRRSGVSRFRVGPIIAEHRRQVFGVLADPLGQGREIRGELLEAKFGRNDERGGDAFVFHGKKRNEWLHTHTMAHNLKLVRETNSNLRRKPAGPGADLLAFLQQEKRTLERIAAQVGRAERFQLRRIREALGLDQREVARDCGMTQQSLSQLEFRENDETISIGKLRKVARAMGFEVVYFLIPTKKGRSPIGRDRRIRPLTVGK